MCVTLRAGSCRLVRQAPGRELWSGSTGSADRPASASHNGEYSRRSSGTKFPDTDAGDTSRVRPARPRTPRPASTPAAPHAPSLRSSGRPDGQPAVSAPAAARALPTAKQDAGAGTCSVPAMAAARALRSGNGHSLPDRAEVTPEAGQIPWHRTLAGKPAKGAMALDQKELVRAVTDRTGLSHEESADTTRAVLEGLAGQLSEGEARRLATDLPDPLAEQLRAPRRRRKGPTRSGSEED